MANEPLHLLYLLGVPELLLSSLHQQRHPWHYPSWRTRHGHTMQAVQPMLPSMALHLNRGLQRPGPPQIGKQGLTGVQPELEITQILRRRLPDAILRHMVHVQRRRYTVIFAHHT
ncbi:MAG: hypothetical protein J3Q66DRAFT_333960 [Benniella sp.]|nr:MAG: hypothetical protein J3Q66DRAFT_340703 [Benniella sp.]KAK3821665.1 MAG: hypothetical protein J3Q66DRAFT_333960 [Benniella sp.]